VEQIWESTVEADAGPTQVELPIADLSFHRAGLLFFELTARSAIALFIKADWSAISSAIRPVSLALVICTYNRELALSANVAAILDDEGVRDRLARIIVVNQGPVRLDKCAKIQALLEKYGSKIHVLEQSNLGGAGGFSRGILEALSDPQLTHVTLMDDDVQTEPESLLRIASFFAISREDIAVGGHMLNGFRRTFLYEAGARIDEKTIQIKVLKANLDLGNSENLTYLLINEPMHYNGWWCFSFPLHFISTDGMPMPLFIRGDDVEFGIRLHNSGKYTIPLPGVAVWHSPFYPSIGNSRHYFVVRNLLITVAVHLNVTPLVIAARVAKIFLDDLLTFRYHDAALTLLALEDFLRGPAILEMAPGVIEEKLKRIADRFPQAHLHRERVLAKIEYKDFSRTKLSIFRSLVVAIVRNSLRPTAPAAQVHLATLGELTWQTVAKYEKVAVDTGSGHDLVILSRSREHFRSLAAAGWGAIGTLYRVAESQVLLWREAHGCQTSIQFWVDYLAANGTPDLDRRI
jgi:galactofuranosylgalactofuranosylrhamnosyl-N-acetylglucosaminyl-diphospho-decaprenol beta-1,5/1,6-galactofuranosyltransferase